MKNKKEWPFSPSDYLSDKNVMPMSMEQEGMYLRLMLHCWTEGSIPRQAEGISRICKDLDVNRVRFNWKTIKVCFKRCEEDPDCLVHPRISKDLKKKKKTKRTLKEEEIEGGQQVYEHYLNQSGKEQRAYRFTDRRKEMIGLALDRGWTVEDMKEAISNLFADDWPGRHKYSGLEYCIGVWPHKGDMVEKWLNRPAGKDFLDDMDLE